MSLAKGTIEIKNLSKRFIVDNTPLEILNNINLTFPGGTFVSILGSSGCGKTTLLRIILGLENNFSGCIDGWKTDSGD